MTVDVSRLPTWRELHRDTAPEIEAMQLAYFRTLPPWEKMERLGQLYWMARELALEGIRHRHPHASPAEQQRLLADLLLGPELAATVYGPLDGTHE